MAARMSELFRRRVPQIFGAYLVASWAVLEFADFVVNRYLLSAGLVDLSFAVLALMAPSVILLAWFHGAPGRDSWGRPEKIGIPLNLVVMVVVLLALFRGQHLGATTTRVVVADEQGNELERLVPKAEFRRNLALFPFDNTSADTSLAWLQHALPLALLHDLRQDLFFDLRAAPHFAGRLREAGYPDGLGVPLPLKREISDELHRDHLLTGTVDRVNGQIVVETELYDVRRGRLIDRVTVSGTEPLEIADSLSVQLKRSLEIPEQHIEEAEDLPVAELITSVEPAFRDYVEAFRQLVFVGDWQTAMSRLRRAREADPSFAYAHFLAYQTAMLGNLGPEAQEAIKAAVEHEYRLAERDRFAAKVEYYHIARQDPAKAVAVAEMQTELFPDDVEARMRLAYLYTVQNDRPAAIQQFERILELDPSQHDMVQAIGELYESMGEFEQALEYYGRYLEQFPGSERSFLAVGDLHRQLGEPEEARANYERALVIDPESTEALIALARLDYTTGRTEEAEARLGEAAEAASTHEQRAAVYGERRELAEWRGEISAAIRYRALRTAELEASTRPPFLTTLDRLRSLDLFVEAGEGAAALDSLAAIQNELAPPWDPLGSLGAVVVYAELEDAAGLSRAVADFDQAIQTLGFENLRVIAVRAEGRLRELEGECERAVELYESAVELEPTRVVIHTDVGRCERKLGRLEEAAASLGRTLSVHAADPEALLELARVREAQGDREGALERVEAALDVWETADAGFEPAAEARALRGRLAGVVSDS